MSRDSLKATFFAECEELLDALNAGVSDIAEGGHDTEIVNAIFRAVHSIKGAAGAFAMIDLVAFAHKFETVLDRIRSGTLEVDGEVLRIITRSSDVLADLVEAAQQESDSVPDAMDGLMAALGELGEPAVAPATGPEPEAFAFEPVAFAPILLDLPTVESSFEIEFTPSRALLDNGHDPLNLLVALARLGTVTVVCDCSRLPALDAIDADESYLSWRVSLTGDVSEGRINEVFAFVEGLCELTVTRVTEEDPAPEEAEPPAGAGAEETIAPMPDPAPSGETAKTADPKPAKQRGAGAQAAATTLRVDPERVDRLINTAGELIINHAAITQKVLAAGVAANSEIMSDLEDYRHLAREIQEGVMAIRAQPVKPLFQRMARIVREAAEATGKDVTLVTEGEATEIDKTLVERLAEPLTHMVRNAVDHGIEAPQVRDATGKASPATVRLTAAHRSGHVQIEVADDGAGIDRERLLQSAIRKGLVPDDAQLTEAEIDNLLFMPGFSTAETVTNLSGRGVGMDVVKTTITSLGGRLSMASEQGKGSVFTISLPLTLAVLDGMIVTVGTETMVLPLASIIETVHPRPEDIVSYGASGTLLAIRGEYVPIVRLADVLGFAAAERDLARSILLLIRTEVGQTVALSVDAISDRQQVVIKGLEGNYHAIPGISAATILGDGKIALIIDADAIVSMAGRMSARTTPSVEKDSRNERIAALG